MPQIFDVIANENARYKRKELEFNFLITHFPFLRCNMQSSPAYWVFVPHIMRYIQDCSSYECFILRARRLSSKLSWTKKYFSLAKTGKRHGKLDSSFRKFYDRYDDLLKQYEFSLSRMFHEHSEAWQVAVASWPVRLYKVLIPILTFTKRFPWRICKQRGHLVAPLLGTCKRFSGLGSILSDLPGSSKLFTSNIPRYFLELIVCYFIEFWFPYLKRLS